RTSISWAIEITIRASPWRRAPGVAAVGGAGAFGIGMVVGGSAVIGLLLPGRGVAGLAPWLGTVPASIQGQVCPARGRGRLTRRREDVHEVPPGIGEDHAAVSPRLGCRGRDPGHAQAVDALVLGVDVAGLEVEDDLGPVLRAL